MNDDLVKGIRELQCFMQPYVDTMRRVNESLRPLAELILKIQQQYAPAIRALSNSCNAWIKDNSHTIDAIIKFAEQAQYWQKQQKQNVVLMAENGWFPNWYTFFYKPEKKSLSLDELMISHLNNCWDDLKTKIIELCPNRKHIIKVAFQLHESENYIASIPLFISQSDGIFCEQMKSFLFAGEKPKIVIEQMLCNGELQRGFFIDILLEPYKIKTQFSEGIRKFNAKDKKKAPNRNGILHGHREHLDYGTEINSLKSLSLLAFVVFSTKDMLGKQKKHLIEE
ncbi:MAG: hypothetical protein ABSB91_07795 [Sedimentisphaerales bacterium]